MALTDGLPEEERDVGPHRPAVVRGRIPGTGPYPLGRPGQCCRQGIPQGILNRALQFFMGIGYRQSLSEKYVSFICFSVLLHRGQGRLCFKPCQQFRITAPDPGNPETWGLKYAVSSGQSCRRACNRSHNSGGESISQYPLFGQASRAFLWTASLMPLPSRPS
jgi:hypothetical protein